MVYSISNNRAIISGQSGIYDNKVTSPEVRYGRNDTDNYMNYTKDLEKYGIYKKKQSISGVRVWRYIGLILQEE